MDNEGTQARSAGLAPSEAEHEKGIEEEFLTGL